MVLKMKSVYMDAQFAVIVSLNQYCTKAAAIVWKDNVSYGVDGPKRGTHCYF
jgi:hypothetical protein